jgi:hypothetical protein
MSFESDYNFLVEGRRSRDPITGLERPVHWRGGSFPGQENELADEASDFNIGYQTQTDDRYKNHMNGAPVETPGFLRLSEADSDRLELRKFTPEKDGHTTSGNGNGRNHPGAETNGNGAHSSETEPSYQSTTVGGLGIEAVRLSANGYSEDKPVKTVELPA